MNEIWTKIQSEISALDKETANSFNQPASESEINLLKTKFENEIPVDFINYLEVFNGQSHKNFEIQPFSYYSLITIEEIIDVIKMQKSLWEEEKINHGNENKIQLKVWDKNWLPFASDGSSYLIVDLNPGKNGVYGQVFQLFSGMDYELDDIVLADSFLEFSETLKNKVIHKEYEMDEDEPILIFNDDWI